MNLTNRLSSFIAIAIFSFTVVQDTDSQSTDCRPLIVFFGGAFDSKSKAMKTLAKYAGNTANIETRYFGFTEGNVSYGFIQTHLDLYPRSPVALVGHSYGGGTAYTVAADWNNNIAVLATLDAVAEEGDYFSFAEEIEHYPRPRNVQLWLNVWKKYGLFGAEYVGGFVKCHILGGFLWDRNDCIADAGGSWGRQRNAKNFLFKGDHADVVAMYRKVSKRILDRLRCT